jgi:ubiquinone/menaquinone biosynthesis C-methylase UbiE
VFPEADLVGVDSSPEMVATARAGWTSGPCARFVCARAEVLPFQDATFDLALSTVSYRHWSDRAAGMREIGRILAPDGLLALADIFVPRRRGKMSVLPRAGRAYLPDGFAESLASARLRMLGVEVVPGFGPIGSVTVVIARRVGQAGV